MRNAVPSESSRLPSRVSVFAIALGICLGVALANSTNVHAQAEQQESRQPPPSGILTEKIPGAERLEGRLLAPCCWNQTLDIHGSEISYALRREIRTRLKAGESPEAVEASLVDRYGPRLRAVPDKVPLEGAGFLGLVVLFAAAGGLVALLLKWRRRSTPTAADSGSLPDKSAADGLDKRLDDELRRLD